MFDNIGTKVKGLATLVFVLGAIVSMVGGAAAGIGAGGFGGFMLFLIIVGVGIVSAYLSVMLLYAFGDLVEKTQRNAEYLSYISEVIGNVDVNIVEIANGKSGAKQNAPSTGSQSYTNNAAPANTSGKLARIANSMNTNGAASKWRCSECDTSNDGATSVCRGCGKSRW